MGHGTWYAENEYTIADFDLTITRNSSTDNATWSFAPLVDLAGRFFEQKYNLNGDFTATSLTDVHDGDLDANMYGAQFGLQIQSPNYDGWRFAVTPTAKVFLADTDMSVMQDKDGVIGGIYTDRLTVSDSDTFVVYEGRLEFDVVKQIENVSFGLNLHGTATSGMPYIEMPEFSGDAAKLNNDGMSYSAGARIGVSVPF
ncbi:hypothetical protein [Sneathiella aquimaris]|uniref:hypothetical protein n=1 Tax=Sneathiella aquimaris TaxID=2599305 RepID=UPI001469F55E|nr:hypothetical protein [Sneathiella aquimaris]